MICDVEGCTGPDTHCVWTPTGVLWTCPDCAAQLVDLVDDAELVDVGTE